MMSEKRRVFSPHSPGGVAKADKDADMRLNLIPFGMPSRPYILSPAKGEGMKLHLNLTGEYFDQIIHGEKKEEYRLCNDHWTKILKPFPPCGNDRDQIVLKRGYPHKTDKTRILILPWQGYEIKTITHPHFGESPVKVFAIKL